MGSSRTSKTLVIWGPASEMSMSWTSFRFICPPTTGWLAVGIVELHVNDGDRTVRPRFATSNAPVAPDCLAPGVASCEPAHLSLIHISEPTRPY